MKFPKPLTLSEVAAFLSCRYLGDANLPALGMNEIHKVERGDISFVDHPKYYEKCLNSSASIVIINKEVACPEGKGLIISEDPFGDFNRLGKKYSPFVSSLKAVSDSSSIGEGSIIQPNVFIGNNVKIGKNCLIHSNVSIYDNTVIGDNVVIQANTVLGSDAFYFKNRGTHREKLLSTGYVEIANDVEIGAGCTIDKGVSGVTYIGRGTKIDNLVQIGHDTEVGEMCLFAAQVGIAGCVKVGKNVILWGQVGVASGVEIGEGAVVLGQSGVGKDLEGGKTYAGTLAQDARTHWKEKVLLKQLPDMIKKLK
ncbi:MAG: UDP-3-O-(3-hydroxymyristoyl)glucosamine N-acyltransferase [Bacteroidetes bacterium]|nr:UDP-3-O-(3-hydroxymyristoyl)glucosamine N-acyltransferase [Bacteroidota bacterium]